MKKQRNIIRMLHLTGAAAIGTYVYSPFSQLEWFTLVVQLMIIPALTLTGIWLWKPKWFRIARKTAPLIALFAISSLNTLQAQDKLVGGSGGFMIGYKTLNTSAFQYFVDENGPRLGDNLVQVGGEGYGLINKWVIGGGGYYSGGQSAEDGNIAYEIDGGGGYLNLGYVVYHTDNLLVFPLLGMGIDALGVERKINEDVAFESDRFLEASYFIVSPNLDLGAGVDWFPGKKGFKLGIRAGYNLSFSQTDEWRHSGGKVTNDNLPSSDLNGFYLRLTVGGGHFGIK